MLKMLKRHTPMYKAKERCLQNNNGVTHSNYRQKFPFQQNLPQKSMYKIKDNITVDRYFCEIFDFLVAIKRNLAKLNTKEFCVYVCMCV